MTGVQIDRVATIYGARPLIGAGVVRPKPRIPILMYHSVSEVGDARAGYYGVTTSPRQFREQMRHLHRRGFQVIALPEALGRLSAGVADDARSVVLTFDDGFDDFRTNAWPVLSEFGFTASMFLPTGFIGAARQSFKGRACLSWADVRALHEEGVSFGAHTVTHPVLHGMDWKEIRRELRDSRLRIEQEIQAPVPLFAYPYAFPQEDRPFVGRFRREVMDEGYSAAVTTIVGSATAGADPFTLKRLPVNEGDDEALFESKLAGGYEWMGRVQLLARRSRKFRSWISRSSS